MNSNQHPSIEKVLARMVDEPSLPDTVDSPWLRQLCMDCGADDVGFVSVDRPEMAAEKGNALRALPKAKTIIGFAIKMDEEPIRSEYRSLTNMEFHNSVDKAAEVGSKIAGALKKHGYSALYVNSAFPMEVEGTYDRMWILSHKLVAEAAGLGHIGHNRLVLHPEFGSYILLGSVLLDRDVTEQSQPTDYNPCIDCKLCVSACPTGAIYPDGGFNFSACYAHNYRHFLTNFNEWVENVADSGSKEEYRERYSKTETLGIWQSLAFKPDYSAAYCMSVCPAGENVLGPFLQDRKQYSDDVVKPLQDKKELIYVLPNSDAEESVPKNFPNKEIKRVNWSLKFDDPFSYLFDLTLTFQRRQAGKLSANYHVVFTDFGFTATININKRKLDINFEQLGEADATMTTTFESFRKFFHFDANIDALIENHEIEFSGDLDKLYHLHRCFAVYGDIYKK